MASADDIRNQGWQGTSASMGTRVAKNTAKPIGVPEDYSYVRGVTPGPAVDPATLRFAGRYGGNEAVAQLTAPKVDVAYPKYFEGDETRQFAWLAPEDIYMLQVELKNLGLLDASKASISWGNVDEDTKAGLKTLLTIANQRGEEWKPTLDRLRAQAQAAGTYGNGAGTSATAAKKPQLRISLTSPTDLASLSDKVAEQRLGRKLTAGEKKAFIATYQQAERGFQTAAFNSDVNNTGGTFTQPPSQTAAAESFMDQNMGSEVGAKNVADTFNNFLDILGGFV